ncbi:MAG: nucleoside recognition domain-containing protein [Candidatus Egerieousia sp.]|nr:nucleoside recognition domain-containing protein [Candidatus Egerieousia sp.]
MKSEILNENPEQVTSTKERLVKCVKEVLPSTTKTCIWLLKITIGVSVLILFMRYFKILPWLSATLGPLFNHFGLPGEAALAYVSGYFVNMYAMLAIAGSMDLTARAITILGVMSLCSHNMITETAVQGKTGANPVRVVITRTLAGFVLAFVLNLILPLSQSDIAMLGGAFEKSEAAVAPAAVASMAEAPAGVTSVAETAPATEASITVAPVAETAPAAGAPATVASITEAPAAVQPLFKELAVEWCYSTLSILVKMTLLIYSLAILQRILSEFGVIRWVSKFLKPLLLLFGLPARCSFLWIIANILGIAYGGAVMMEEVRAGKLSLRDIKLVNQHIGISHSNLEDLTLVASIGGIWWVMLLSRWAGSFILVWGYRAEMAIRKKLLTLQTKTTL